MGGADLQDDVMRNSTAVHNYIRGTCMVHGAGDINPAPPPPLEAVYKIDRANED